MPPVAQPAIVVGKCLAAHFQLASLISNESEDREGGSFGKRGVDFLFVCVCVFFF